MLETIKKRVRQCGLISLIFALILVAFQFIPFWEYDTSYKTEGEILAIETRNGQWEHVDRATINARSASRKAAKDAAQAAETAAKDVVDAVSALETAKAAGDTEGVKAAQEKLDASVAAANEAVKKAQDAGAAFDAETAEYVAEAIASGEKAQWAITATSEEIANVSESKEKTTVAKSVEKSFSPYSYVWHNFRDTEFLEYLSFESGEVVNFSDVLTPHVSILLTGLLVILISLIKRESIIGAFAAIACGVCGIAGMFFSNAYMLGDSFFWFVQLVSSLAICLVGALKFYFAVRVKERQAVEEELA